MTLHLDEFKAASTAVFCLKRSKELVKLDSENGQPTRLSASSAKA